MNVEQLKNELRKRKLPVFGNKAELKKRFDESKSIPKNVVDTKLYLKIREEIKKNSKAWPSIYASSQLVQEYKRRGGRYSGKKPTDGLDRWYQEDWVNVCKKGSSRTQNKYSECGRKKSDTKKYPYCRPYNRVSKETPMTVKEIEKKYGNKKLEKMCKKKRRKGLPKKRVSKRVTLE